MSPGNGEHPPRDPRQLDGLDTYPVAQVEAFVERVDELVAENKTLRDRFSDADTERNVAQAALKAAFARFAELEVDNKAMRDRIAKLEDCIETAWGIIANAGGGDWNTQTPKWKEAAESWRDNKFHPILNDTFAVRAKVEWGER